MKPMVLLPEPKQIHRSDGFFACPEKATIGVSDYRLHETARRVARLFSEATIAVSIPGMADTVTLAIDAGLRPDEYALLITRKAVTLLGQSEAAVFYGLQTLAQIAEQFPPDRLPCLAIHDWPDFRDRGLYYDVCRGRVPTLERLQALATTLAQYKINQFQLYIEHTFAFRGHPDIGAGASPLTAEDILALDAHCRRLHIELVPSLASFGHLATVLRHPRYQHLAEDWGCGRLTAPEAQDVASWGRRPGWSLAPANPEIYSFLNSLFAEFLPLFSSSRFNVCCDETMDLGLGQSEALCRQRGKGVVYLEHIRSLSELARRHGKRIMFWGDIIRHHPELIPQIPREAVVLDWGYGANHPFDRIKDFKAAGLEFYACPGTSSWVSLFPRLPEARANISGFARAGVEHGARGLLNTDWGDGGHYNFMEYSYPGYLFGAEQAWNVGADTATFSSRFCRLFLRNASPDLVEALDRLGEISQLSVAGWYQSIWQAALFAHPSDPVFTSEQPCKASFVKGGVITNGPFTFDAAYGAAVRRQLAGIRRVFARHAADGGTDPEGVLPYWIFAVDTLDCASRKLAAFGAGAHPAPSEDRAIRATLKDLKSRFEQLWTARNRRSEIDMTLQRYDVAIAGDRLTLQFAAGGQPGTARLTIANVGEHDLSGDVTLRLVPAEPATIEGGRRLRIDHLPPGVSITRDVSVRFGGDLPRVLLEAVSDIPAATTASISVPRP